MFPVIHRTCCFVHLCSTIGGKASLLILCGNAAAVKGLHNIHPMPLFQVYLLSNHYLFVVFFLGLVGVCCVVLSIICVSILSVRFLRLIGICWGVIDSLPLERCMAPWPGMWVGVTGMGRSDNKCRISMIRSQCACTVSLMPIGDLVNTRVKILFWLSEMVIGWGLGSNRESCFIAHALRRIWMSVCKEYSSARYLETILRTHACSRAVKPNSHHLVVTFNKKHWLSATR